MAALKRNGPKPLPDSQRFWRNVWVGDGASCWIWAGSYGSNGYGLFIFHNRRHANAHRAAWVLTNGEPPKGMEICHRFDNRGCVKLDHLFLGTRSDNMKDAVAKGRFLGSGVRGVRHGMAALTESQVREIHDSNDGCRLLSKRYGISSTHACRIRSGKVWRHLWA